MSELYQKKILSKEIINDYTVVYYDDDSYKAFDKNNNVVYTVTRDSETGKFNLKTTTKTGNKLSMKFDEEHPFSPYDIKPNGTVIDANGKEVVFTDGVVTRASLTDDDKYIVRVYDKFKTEFEYDQKDGNLLFERTYDDNNKLQSEKDIIENKILYYNRDDQYCAEDEDGTKTYLDGEEVSIIIDKNGTCFIDGEKVNYIVDNDGNIICTDKNNNKIYYNKYGHKYKTVTNDGSIYNHDNEAQLLTRNGKTSYTRINHIEYDEEEYDKILKTLNEIEGSKIRSICMSVETKINDFPDHYTGDITRIDSDISEHIDLIESLKMMTNYSLLAYETCDENLRKELESLVNSIFGDSNPVLASSFKTMINNTIENKDGILKYKMGTNFVILAKNAIPTSVYTDENGNKWYLNRSNTIIGFEGKDLKINYGDETFDLTYDDNGIIKLIDYNGNKLDIFGDYNIGTRQYGSNQMVVRDSYDDQSTIEIVSQYFPDSTMEEKTALLSKITNSGCGYAAVTNMIFKEFEGKEEEFYQTYGFPMYKLKKSYTDDSFVVDYNYEPVITDLFCTVNCTGDSTIKDVTINGRGTGSGEVETIYNYLSNKGINIGNAIRAEDFISDRGYTIYEMDGSVFMESDNNIGHAMIITGYTDDGRIIVSTWGKKAIYEKSSNDEYIKQRKEVWKNGIKPWSN